MLFVYTYPRKKPLYCIDLSKLPLDQFADAALALHSHQKSATIWFGYLEGWMLTPQEEVLLRKVIRKFDCIVVTNEALSFSQAWKNEIDSVFTEDIHAH